MDNDEIYEKLMKYLIKYDIERFNDAYGHTPNKNEIRQIEDVCSNAISEGYDDLIIDFLMEEGKIEIINIIKREITFRLNKLAYMSPKERIRDALKWLNAFEEKLKQKHLKKIEELKK